MCDNKYNVWCVNLFKAHIDRYRYGRNHDGMILFSR